MRDKAEIAHVDYEAIQARLIAIRMRETDADQKTFAEKLGLHRTRWNNYERGYPLTLDILCKIVAIVDGVTSSYITHGRTEGMPPALKRELAPLENEAKQKIAAQKAEATRRRPSSKKFVTRYVSTSK